MKKLLVCLVVIVVVATIALLSVQGYAGTSGWRWPRWRLYDNFNYPGPPDPNRWNIDDSSATITIENGRAKFVHEAGHEDDSSFLSFKMEPYELRRIRGVRVTVTVTDCSTVPEDVNDVRARIGGYVGKLGDDDVWDQLALQGGLNRIFGALNASPDGSYWYDLVWATFERPIEIIGNTFTITMIFSKRSVTYQATGLGTITFTLPGRMSPMDNYFMGIGTRSTSGLGSCTAYFDNVYILY
jgi:hypothetical protein